MAQGFKAKLPAKKAKSSAVVQKQKAITKKGTRKVAPKDPVLISQQTKTKSSSSSHGKHFEELAASKVKGKLNLMKESAEKGQAMSAEQKAKGR